MTACPTVLEREYVSLENEGKLLSVTVNRRENGVITGAFNLTGYTATLSIYNNRESRTLITSYAATITAPLAGQMTVQTTSAATATAGTFYYRLDITLSGNSTAVVVGDWVVLEG